MFRKGREVIQDSLGCTTQRQAQGLEGLVGGAGLRVVQLKLREETTLNYRKVLHY